tara:strand:- start:184 stop:390 length:207 start_codon:yes stop_codon:yes gene_type:complete
MKIIIRIDKNYGVETAYPACAQSRLLADLAGTKTLTRRALDTIAALGYQITIAQETNRTFKHLETASC